MSRSIKFKVWDVDEKEWYNNEKIPYQLIDNEGVFCWADDYEWNRYPGEVLIVQFTGLKDRNGTDIYEGDILSTDLSRPYLVVEFRNGSFMYQCQDNGKDYYDIMMPIEVEHNQDKFAEVIGNIYQHPELLGDN